jgi:hypothetical protein
LAGACSGITTVEALDTYNNRISTAVTVTLSLSGTSATGAALYSDSTCTTALGGTLSIPVGPGAGDFYFKAITGGTLTVTAQASGLTQATQNETITNMVRQGTCTIAGGSTSSTGCTISPALANLNKSILFFQATNGSSGTGSNSTVECWINTTSQISCSRDGTTGTMNIAWRVVEFPVSSGVLVQRIHQACATTINLPTRIDPAQSFVLYSSTNTSTAIGSTRPYKRVVLSDDGTNSRVSLSYCTASDNVDIQVVQILGAVVVRGNVNWDNGTATRTVSPLADAPANRTFLLYTTDIVNSGDACGRLVRGALPSTGGVTNSISFSRGDSSGSCGYGETINLGYERVLLPAGMTVQQMTTNMAGGTGTATATLTAVDTTRATAFNGGQTGSGQATGESANTTDGNPNYARALNALTSSTALQLTRANTSSSARFTSYVVEWAVPPPP